MPAVLQHSTFQTEHPISVPECSVSAGVQSTRPGLAVQVTDNPSPGGPGRADLKALKEEFMLLANHELRTPATIVSAALEMLAEVQADNLTPIQKKFLRQAREGMQRLNAQLETLNNILACSAPVPDLHLGEFSCQHLLETVAREAEPHLKQRGQRLEISGAGKQKMKGDLLKLKNTLLELVSNASKNSPDGSSIAIKIRPGNEQVRIEVVDQARPIPEEAWPEIFQPFYQLGDLSKHHSSKFDFEGGGPGLGLYLCQKVVKAHGGSIRGHHNRTGRGNTFVVTLPAGVFSHPAEQSAPVSAKNLNILNIFERNRQKHVSAKVEPITMVYLK